MKIRKQTALWTCKDGSKIRVCDMDYTHLLNSIKLLERAHTRYLEDSFSFSSLVTGEMASHAAELDIDYAMQEGPSYYFPIYENLKLELERRKESEGFL